MWRVTLSSSTTKKLSLDRLVMGYFWWGGKEQMLASLNSFLLISQLF